MNHDQLQQIIEACRPGGAASGCWQIDRKVGLAVILAIIIHASTLIWWAAKLDSRVDILERSTVRTEATYERMVTLEGDVKWIRRMLEQQARAR